MDIRRRELHRLPKEEDSMDGHRCLRSEIQGAPEIFLTKRFGCHKNWLNSESFVLILKQSDKGNIRYGTAQE
jgi:hypothetical protein